MKVSIIILNYNSGKLIEKCVSSVLKTQDMDFEIIVVDNASRDKSHLLCKQKFPSINLVENKTNLGYCEGNNIGIKKAKGEFIVILNPDTEVEPDWLKELMTTYQKNGPGLYQPKIMDGLEENLINNTGNMITLFGFHYSRGRGEEDIGKYEVLETIGYPTGACIFTSKKTLEKLGYFVPFFFAYYDDFSLAWRAAHVGIASYYVPSSVILHLEGYSFKNNPKKFFLNQRNRWYCLLTHYSRKTFYKILPSILVLEIFVIVNSLLKGMFTEKIRSYLDLIKNRDLIKKTYEELESKKHLSDKEIISNFMYKPQFSIISQSDSNKIFDKLQHGLTKLSLLVI